jgi:hypothetical protein
MTVRSDAAAGGMVRIALETLSGTSITVLVPLSVLVFILIYAPPSYNAEATI